MSFSLRGLVAGGQTGVDRAALDTARDLGLPAAGWCPAGRTAEDGLIPTRYELRETPSDDPAQRTAWNVFDTDATLVLSRGTSSPGTALTVDLADRYGRPLRQLVGTGPGEVAAIRQWLAEFQRPPLLNVAGPRETEDPGIGAWARTALTDLLAPPAGALPDRQEIRPRKVLVTGGAGYLGNHLLRFKPPGWQATGTVRQGKRIAGLTPVDLSERDAVDALWDSVRPSLVIHTAYSMAEGERDIWNATRNVADATARVGSELIHISSDMVLDGVHAPFSESAAPGPVHEYGRWKARAEEYVRSSYPQAAIVRASLLTSFDPPDPRTQWVISGLQGEREVRLFVDEFRTPILITDIARQIWEMARLPVGRRRGTWNLAGPESVSRYALGLMAAAATGLDPSRLIPAHSAEAPGPRPRDLRLLVERADRELPTRARALSEAVAEAAGRTLARREDPNP